MHGWEPLRREVMPDSLRVSYHQPIADEWAPVPPDAPVTAPARQPVDVPAIALLVGGLMVAAASFLPWATVTAGFVSVSVSGMDGSDGWISLGLGALITLMGLSALTGNGGKGWLAATILGILAAGLGAFHYFDLTGRVASTTTQALMQVGIGLWLLIAGGVVATLASFGFRSGATRPA